MNRTFWGAGRNTGSNPFSRRGRRGDTTSRTWHRTLFIAGLSLVSTRAKACLHGECLTYFLNEIWMRRAMIGFHYVQDPSSSRGHNYLQYP